MFRNFHNSRGSSAHAGNQKSRWRNVFIALVLAVAIGSAGQAPSVQAAPARDARIFMFARPETTKPICVGDTALITVNVKKYEFAGEESATLLGTFIGVNVHASVVTPSIGMINPTSALTRANQENRAVFIFSALKPGTTRIEFSGKVNQLLLLGRPISSGDTVTAATQLTVVQCVYDIQVISTFRVGMTSVGTSNQLVFLVDKERDESTFYVNWVTSALCGINSPISESKATVVTERVGNNIKVNVTFLPSSSIGGGTCGVSVATDNTMKLALSPLTIIVPPEGGSATIPQTVKAKNGSFTGSAFISVTPLYKK